MTLKRRHKYILVALCLYWPAIFVATHIPIPQMVRQSGLSDKTMHLVTYMILAFLLWFALEPYRKIDWRYIKPWCMLLGIAAYGLIDEWLQLFVGRGADIFDFVSNMLGTLIAMTLLTLLEFWTALLVITGLVIFTFTNLSSAAMIISSVPVNTVFHFGAYAFLTLNWVHILWRFRMARPAARILLEAAFPLGFLALMKAIAAESGKDIFLIDIYTACAGIGLSLLVAHLVLSHPRIRRVANRQVNPGSNSA